jgi:hypothetical protein
MKKEQEALPADTIHQKQEADTHLGNYFNSATIRTETSPAGMLDAQPVNNGGHCNKFPFFFLFDISPSRTGSSV